MAMMMKSPYSGRLVKVRDQDRGRAIRDEEGRVFYVVQRSDGQGYYAARTRHGSEKEEAAYLALEEKPAAKVGAETGGREAVHDATGKGRGVRPVVWLVMLILLAAAYLSWMRYAQGHWLWQRSGAVPATQPTSHSTTQPTKQVGAGERPGASLWVGLRAGSGGVVAVAAALELRTEMGRATLYDMNRGWLRPSRY